MQNVQKKQQKTNELKAVALLHSSEEAHSLSVKQIDQQLAKHKTIDTKLKLLRGCREEKLKVLIQWIEEHVCAGPECNAK